MKKRVSIAFVLMCAVTLLSIVDIINIFPSIFGLFRDFRLGRLLGVICNCISRFVPVAIAVWLYLNRKRDIKDQACVGLIVGGMAELIGFVLNFSFLEKQLANVKYYSKRFDTVEMIEAFVGFIESLAPVVLGILLIAVAISVKKGKTSFLTNCIAWTYMLLGTTVVALSIYVGDFILYSLKVLMLGLGLFWLPETIYNYDNCDLFFDKKFAKMIVCAVIFLLIYTSIILGSDESGKGNCFNCEGDGWDSANSCSCIWCGGDGYASWNP